MNPLIKKTLQILAWGLALIAIPLLFVLWIFSCGMSIILLQLIVKMHPGLKGKVDRLIDELFLDVSVLRPSDKNPVDWGK